MERHGQITTYEERIRIDELAITGHTDPQIAEMMGRSVWTIRKWRRRVQHGGRSRLQSTFGRPRRGPLSTFPPAVATAIRQLRVDFPGWGPTTIRVALTTDPTWYDQPIPSRARIAAFLKHEGLTRRYLRHSTLVEPPRLVDPPPHGTWQVDAKGPYVDPSLGKVSLINVVDVCTHLKLESYPALEHSPGLASYQLALRRAFTTFGLPERISFDHGTVFYDNTTPSPFPTRMHLWLIALGIEVAFIRPRRPTDHGFVERTHQTMAQQVLAGQRWEEQQVLWGALDDRRAILNTIYPSRTLDNQAPLQVYPAADHSGRDYQAQWEADLIDMDLVGAYLACGRWFRRTSPQSHLGIGGMKYWLGDAWCSRSVLITFDPVAWQFVVQPQGSTTSLRLVPRDLTAAALMGDLARLEALPGYQLGLPVNHAGWQASQIAACAAHESC